MAPRLNTRKVFGLQLAMRRDVVQRVLQEQGRNLSKGRVDEIVESRGCANPLFLRTLLEELSVVAVDETLDADIQKYLKCSGPRDLFRAILGRVYNQHKGAGGGASVEGFAAEAARAILLSRHGMAESELVELLRVGKNDGPAEVREMRLLSGSSSLL
eukprot:tig00020675_g12613.t1